MSILQPARPTHRGRHRKPTRTARIRRRMHIAMIRLALTPIA